MTTMGQRYYSSNAQLMSLVGGIDSSALSLVVNATGGLPTSTPFTLILDKGLSEEIVTVTAVAGVTLTVTRGEDGTAAQAHVSGCEVRHGFSARDLREPQQHMDSTSGVHGLPVTDAVVGTATSQVLRNKTMRGTDNAFSDIPQGAVIDLPIALDALRVALQEESTVTGEAIAAIVAARDAAWVTYTPTVGGLTVGNGTVSARAKKVGPTVHCSGLIVLGSTSAMTGTLTVSLPYALGGVHNSNAVPLGVASIVSGASSATCAALPWSTTSMALRTTSGVAVSVGAPWTWVSGNTIGWSVTYETGA